MRRRELHAERVGLRPRSCSGSEVTSAAGAPVMSNERLAVVQEHPPVAEARQREAVLPLAGAVNVPVNRTDCASTAAGLVGLGC